MNDIRRSGTAAAAQLRDGETKKLMRIKISRKWIVLAILVVCVKVAWDRGLSDAWHVDAEMMTGPVPELIVQTPAGRERRLVEAYGQPALVHFWATWCAPCREELPTLLEYAESPSTLPVWIVSVDEDWDTVRRFFNNRVPPSVVLVDPRSDPQGFGLSGVPTTFLIDATGQFRARFSGARDWSLDQVREAVAKLAAGNVSSAPLALPPTRYVGSSPPADWPGHQRRTCSSAEVRGSEWGRVARNTLP